AVGPCLRKAARQRHHQCRQHRCNEPPRAPHIAPSIRTMRIGKTARIVTAVMGTGVSDPTKPPIARRYNQNSESDRGTADMASRFGPGDWWQSLYDDIVAELFMVSRDARENSRTAWFLIHTLGLDPGSTAFAQGCGIGTLLLPLPENRR